MLCDALRDGPVPRGSLAVHRRLFSAGGPASDGCGDARSATRAQRVLCAARADSTFLFFFLRTSGQSARAGRGVDVRDSNARAAQAARAAVSGVGDHDAAARREGAAAGVCDRASARAAAAARRGDAVRSVLCSLRCAVWTPLAFAFQRLSTAVCCWRAQWWRKTPELQRFPVICLSGMARRCIASYQTYINQVGCLAVGVRSVQVGGGHHRRSTVF
eukprot:1827756-Rhodomonas_salina.1